MKFSRICLVVLATLAIVAPTSSALAGFPDQWTKDPENPISTDFSASTVLYDEGIYKAWGDALDGINYATSPDGRVWTIHPDSPVLLNGPEWYDATGAGSPSVVIVDGLYHMYYSCVAAGVDNDDRIARATSTDGIEWTKDPANPMENLDPTLHVDNRGLMFPHVIYEEPVFRMWYVDETTLWVLYATSLDGVDWTMDSNPALVPGDPGSWEAYLFAANVIFHRGTYYMFYTGGVESGLNPGAPDPILELGIGYAVSEDGIEWVKRSPSEPVLVGGGPGTWDDLGVFSPVVLATDTNFTMWHSGSDTDVFEESSFGLATSEIPSSPIYDFGPYSPLCLDASWTYQSVVDTASTYVESVCCPHEIDGQPALISKSTDSETQVACWNDGSTVTYYGYYEYEGAEFTDLVPDLIFGSFEDGSIIVIPCDAPPCDEYELIRVWDQLTHPDLLLYGIDPNLEDVIVIAHYAGGDPNSQNAVIESNLPAGITPPPGAVTDLEWLQRGVGKIAYIGVDASSGDLGEKYVLIDSEGTNGTIVVDPRPRNLAGACPPSFVNANWILSGPAGFDTTGTGFAYLENQPPGEYSVIWSDSDGWQTPDPPQVTCSLAACETIEFIGEYLNLTTLIVNSEPNYIIAPFTLQNSEGDCPVHSACCDAAISLDKSGDWIFTWGEVTGWARPDPNPVYFSVAQGDTINISGTYNPGSPIYSPVVVAFSLGQCIPNPFNPQTTISFELPQQEVVSLHVFDVGGRLVRTLIGGEVYGQGRHEAIWQGRGDSGRQCASGTYFYRFEAGEFQEAKRMVLLR